MTAHIVVVGSVNLDLSVRVDRLPRRGQTISGDEARRSPGGKGANQAVALARLGVRTTLMAMVGADTFGSQLRAELDGRGVDTSHVGTAPAATGLALIVVDADGDNMITVAPGANGHFAPEHLDVALLASADALLLQLEVPLDTALAAARAARSGGVPVILNAAPLPTGERPGEVLADLLAVTDLLVVNETEAAALTGGDRGRPEATAAHLLRHGPAQAVCTLGAHGALAVQATGIEHVAAYRVDAVDAVGAGDAFCAALTVASTAGGLDLPAAVRRACGAGALATTRRGAQSAAPTSAELDAFLGAVHAR